MEKTKYKLILGSQSPRRKELLAYSFLPFDIITSDVEEVSALEDVSEYVKEIAQLKAKDCFTKAIHKYTNPLVIGADTIVCLENDIIGKPKNSNEAKEILRKLSGKTHQVYTGISYVSSLKEISFAVKSLVSFDDITEDLLDLYLKTGESLDKAGAYGIQSHALSFINKLEGSYSNVVGLPINEVIKQLKNFVGDNKNWRESFE